MVVFKKLNIKDSTEVKSFIKLKKKSIKEGYIHDIFLTNSNNFDIPALTKNNFFLLKGDSSLLGFLSYKHSRYRKIKHNFYISNIYIDSDKQGQGYGTILLCNIEDYIIKTYKLPLIALHLNVTESNKRAIHFYKKLGYITISIDTTKIHDHGYIGSVTMKKIIEEK